LGYKFRRQHPAGRYILDFYCHDANLGIELDGGGHLNESQSVYDESRTEELAGMGIKVIRFWNNEVLQQTEAVLEVITYELQSRAPKISGE
jgi:very-short-patch-repair endonuclease